MKFWHVALGMLGLYAISSTGSMADRAERSAARRTESQRVSEFVRESKDAELEKQRLSGVALSRYRSNCVLVVAGDTQAEVFHSEGIPAIDFSTGERLPPDTTVCNKRGWTALLNEDGLVSAVAVATRHDSDNNNISDIDDVRRILNGGQ